MKVSEFVGWVTAISLIGGVAWWAKTLDGRVGTLEAAPNFESQVRTLETLQGKVGTLEDRVATQDRTIATLEDAVRMLTAQRNSAACSEFALKAVQDEATAQRQYFAQGVADGKWKSAGISPNLDDDAHYRAERIRAYTADCLNAVAGAGQRLK